MYNKGPFASWVPKPVMLVLILVILFPIMSVMGVYTGNATDISGAFATYPEFISMANNATAIGMGLAIMIAMRIKMRFRTKEIIAGCSIILAALSYMNGTTDNVWVLVAGSFLIGFFKIFPLIEIILPVMFMLSPTGDRGRFYAIFYPISIGFGQLSSYYLTSVVFDTNWQAPYFIMAGVMLVIAALSLIFQHNQRFCFKKPLYQIDLLSMVMLSGSGMCFNVFFTFMRQQGWFTSPYITGALAGGIVLLALTIYRQQFLKRKLVNFDLFYKLPNLLHSIILLLFLGIYLASTSLYVQYAVGVLGYNNLVNARVNLWMIPGIVAAGILAFFGFKNKWPIKYYIASGFISFFLYTLSLYLLIQPQMNIGYLEWSMILKGLGMGILFIGIWFYASLDLSMDDLLGAMGILLIMRSFLVTAIGGAIISWAGYQGQWQSLNDISLYLDTGDIPNGMAIYQNAVINAMLASSKVVLGSLCWLIIPILISVAGHRYGHFNFRRVVLLRKMIRGNTIKGYRLS